MSRFQKSSAMLLTIVALSAVAPVIQSSYAAYSAASVYTPETTAPAPAKKNTQTAVAVENTLTYDEVKVPNGEDLNQPSNWLDPNDTAKSVNAIIGNRAMTGPDNINNNGVPAKRSMFGNSGNAGFGPQQGSSAGWPDNNDAEDVASSAPDAQDKTTDLISYLPDPKEDETPDPVIEIIEAEDGVKGKNPLDDGMGPGSESPTQQVTMVPEPATFALLGLGFIGLIISRRRSA